MRHALILAVYMMLFSGVSLAHVDPGGSITPRPLAGGLASGASKQLYFLLYLRGQLAARRGPLDVSLETCEKNIDLVKLNLDEKFGDPVFVHNLLPLDGKPIVREDIFFKCSYEP